MAKRLSRTREALSRGQDPRLLSRATILAFGVAFLAGVGAAAAVTLSERAPDEVPSSHPVPKPWRFGESPQAERMLLEAEGMLQSERYSEAYTVLTRAAKLLPRDPRPQHGLGEVYRHLDRAELAAECYRRALQRDPTFLPAKYRRARTLRVLGQNEEALELLDSLLREPDAPPGYHLEVAKNQLQLGRAREAAVSLERYVRAVPASAYGFAHLGRALAQAGDRERAEAMYLKSIEIDPRLTLSWLWFGQLLVSQGRKPEADEALRRFRFYRDQEEEVRNRERDLLRRPDDFVTLMKLAKARTILGRYEEALIAMDRAVTLRPDDEDLKTLREKVASSGRAEAERRRRLEEEEITSSR